MVPRWVAVVLALVIWFLAIPLVHGGVPWALSTLTPRYGWADGTPGVWNRLGAVLISAAAALLIWVLIIGIAHTPDKVRLGLRSSFLITDGPYRFTRNPMYVAEIGLWLGWALLFGSLLVLAGAVTLWLIVNFIILPREERGLQKTFGQTYLRYKIRTPRWFGVAPNHN